MTEINEELEKIRYHIKLLSETIDYKEYPIQSLILDMNWDSEDIERAHDIFEKYDTKIENKKRASWTEFELELEQQFNIGYQTVKSIVLAFFRNYQWTQVCIQYANSKMCAEFHEIARSDEYIAYNKAN